jgi:CP family cyanate transporter-like MFS transporter
MTPTSPPLARRSQRPDRFATALELAPALAAIVLLTINLRTVIASLPPLLTGISADLGLSGVAAGLLTTLPAVGFGVLAPLAPRMARSMSLERLLTGCAALTALGAGLRGVDGTGALFAGTLVAGAGMAVAQATLPILISARYTERMGLFTGAYTMALPLGAGLGALAAVPLENALGGSWRASLAAWAIPGAVATLVWLPAALRRGTRANVEAPVPLRREPLAWQVALFMGIQSMAFYAALAWLPTILEAEGYSSGHAGTLLAVNALVSVPTAFLVPVLAARRPRQLSLLLWMVGVTVAGTVGLLVLPSVAPLWIVVLGLGYGGTLGLGMILPTLRAADGATAASLMAMNLCVGYLVASMGPWVLGGVHDLSGDWVAPLLALLGITLLTLVPGLPAVRDRVVGARTPDSKDHRR